MRETTTEQLRNRLRSALTSARHHSDSLFDLVRPEHLYARPIAERHRMIFYLGHLETFDWNMICGAALGMDPIHPAFAHLFAFGIDPVDGDLPGDQPRDWPGLTEIHNYNRRVRGAVDQALDGISFDGKTPYCEDGLIFRVAVEHRLMHAETFAYMMHWLPHEMKSPPAHSIAPDRESPSPDRVRIPAGEADLGLVPTHDVPFGWDNEFDAHAVQVPSFSIDRFNITNGRFLEFVNAGGYQERSLWAADSWQWIESEGMKHPKFWSDIDGRRHCRTMFSDIPLPLSWPVYVSHAEASAYAKWRGSELPSEAQFHRAAFGAADNPLPRGNFGLQRWTPEPVGFRGGTESGHGVSDLVGNGWEWTSSVFEPFPGFKQFPFYPGYSANFFDGKHFVMKGASPLTPAGLVRPSFRNWFQPHYPYIYATFRCIENQD